MASGFSVVLVCESAGVLETVQQAGQDAAKLAAAPLWSLPDDELLAVLDGTHRWEQSVAALKIRAVQEAVARGLPARHRQRTTGWLRSRLLLDPQPARDLAQQAAALRTRPVIEEALIDGRIDARQAAVIASAVNDIPPEVPAEDAEWVTREAEATLLDMAARLPSFQLRRAGERILAHVAPDIADRVDEAYLRRQEARARRKRFFTLSLPVDGMVRLTGCLPAEDAAAVQAALHPLTRPIPGDDRTPRQRRADALTDLCRTALRQGDLPDHGGEPPQVTVTVPFDPLTKAFRTATLDNGQRLSAQTARRMACDAQILPAVLGGAGQVLDAGRSRRLATGPLRRALVARDRGCAFADCDYPPRWCDAHHLTHWSDGGPTNLSNLVLLCRRHHRVIHDPDSGWRVRMGDDELPEFLPPPWTDPAQRPRRNAFHPRT